MVEGKSEVSERRVHALKIELTEEQREAISRFWQETGSLGGVEILVYVVNDRISPASIQVGTAK
jgi:hypothetical protein